MSSPGTGIHYIVDVPASEYGLGKRGSADLQQSFTGSPMNIRTPVAGVGIAGPLTNIEIVKQANNFLNQPIEDNDLFGGTVDLRYHHPDGPERLEPPNFASPDQVFVDPITEDPIFAWAPNVATGDLNTGRQPDAGVRVAINITNGAGAAFNAPPNGNNPKATSENISQGLKIGSLRMGIGSAPLPSS